MASFDLELDTAGGSPIWLNLSVLVFEPLRVSPALIVHIAHDITASRRRRALYERLRETAREITRFADEESQLVPVTVLTHQEERVLSAFARGRTPARVGSADCCAGSVAATMATSVTASARMRMSRRA